MSTTHSFDFLPREVLTLSGYDFFQFVKTTLGEAEADLLNKISVKSTSTFLNMEDPLEIFNYDIDDEELNDLKHKLCFTLKNQKLLIKPGVISGFHSLKNALKKRANEDSIKARKKKQAISNNNSSSITTLATTTEKTINESNRLSLSEHKDYVLKFIKRWCEDNKKNLGLDVLDLQENFDFTLSIDLDDNCDLKASIKCKCNKMILLGKNDDRIQMSNYYKHLFSTGCDHMKNLRKNGTYTTSTQSTPPQQQQSTSCTSLFSTQSEVSPSEARVVVRNDLQYADSNTSSGSTSEVISNGKRRLTSRSQQYSSKRRRT